MNNNEAGCKAVYYTGVLKPEATGDYSYCKESKVVATVHPDSITVDEGYTSSILVIEVENEDGKFTGNCLVDYHYVAEGAVIVENAVLDENGNAPEGSVIGDNGHVVEAKFEVFPEGAGEFEVEDISDLCLSIAFEPEVLDRVISCNGVDAEAFLSYMKDLESAISEKTTCQEFVDFIEGMKVLKRA